MTDLQRLTQPDWCNAPQPSNWHNACMRLPEHEGDHAVRKAYAWDQAWYWPQDGGRLNWRYADAFPDLWDLDDPPDRLAAVERWGFE